MERTNQDMNPPDLEPMPVRFYSSHPDLPPAPWPFCHWSSSHPPSSATATSASSCLQHSHVSLRQLPFNSVCLRQLHSIGLLRETASLIWQCSKSTTFHWQRSRRYLSFWLRQRPSRCHSPVLSAQRREAHGRQAGRPAGRCGADLMLEEFSVEPMNSAVLRGSTARFNATVQGDWEEMTWFVQSLLVLVIRPDAGPVERDQFSARLCSNGSISCVEFSIRNVSREQAGPVHCTLLGPLGTRTAQLEVQESGTVFIEGGNRTADQGDTVEFQCKASAWFPAPNFTWTQNGAMLDSGLYTVNSTPHGDSFNSTSVLRFPADSSTTVRCLVTVSALTTPMSSSVFLEVFPDWTVLIAVVVSFGGFALLVLLIILIIFCCRRRKERKPTYNDEMMRARTHSQLSRVQAPGRRQGKVNTAYVPDGRTSVTPSDVADGDFFHHRSSDILEMPDIVNSSHAGNFTKHRHVTIV
ncbi:immunoglobulin superfamily member 5 [Salarias fasciatus]|uniref:immunoglobulin superfamily member 5 n=1 Tax=Salarias fasciatus TaxID=181472 RepID=UPI001176B7C8|nr:immunoglobulin superfamily member 5-like [Salarias fasciatus]